MGAHALLGPSGATRWMICTPSARLEEEFEDNDSMFAKEGTEAHALLEAYLLDDPLKVAEIQLLGEFHCGEMEEAAALYIDIVREQLQEALKRDPRAILQPEQKVFLTKYIPEGFGTADTTIIGGNILEITDLKYGKGVPVSAVNNTQLKLYGLGAYLANKDRFDIDTIRMTIIQPRLSSVTHDEIKLKDLIKWAEEEVRPRALLAWEGLGEFVPGNHCKFCKAKPRCKAMADHNLKMIEYGYCLPHKLTDAEIGDVLSKIDRLRSWSYAVKEYALYQTVNKGLAWPGWKLVEGRSNRYIRDKDRAEMFRILQAQGVPEAMLYKPREPQGVTALEALVGKRKFERMLDRLLIKPQGKPTLVPNTDPRRKFNAASKALEDFKDFL